MNAAERLICSSSPWRYLTRRHLLPWLLSKTSLGHHLLEIGAGYGAATAALQSRLSRVTALEYDHKSALKLKSRNSNATTWVVGGDAARLPFASQTFSAALAALVLHHLKTTELQDQTFAETFRVLQPGGVFIIFEIMDGWFNRAFHIHSTFTPVRPDSVFARLSAVGFSKINLDKRAGSFRLTAIRPTE